MLTMTECYDLFLDLLAGEVKPEDLKGEDVSSLKMIYYLFQQHWRSMEHYNDLKGKHLPREQWKIENDPVKRWMRVEQILSKLRVLIYSDHPYLVVMQRACSKSEFALFWAYVIQAKELVKDFDSDKQMWEELAVISGSSPDKLRKDATKLYYQHNRLKVPDAKNKITKACALLFSMGFYESRKLALNDLGAIG
jgi:hypothetical protein